MIAENLGLGQRLLVWQRKLEGCKKRRLVRRRDLQMRLQVVAGCRFDIDAPLAPVRAKAHACAPPLVFILA
jgi:hypothetical protein